MQEAGGISWEIAAVSLSLNGLEGERCFSARTNPNPTLFEPRARVPTASGLAVLAHGLTVLSYCRIGLTIAASAVTGARLVSASLLNLLVELAADPLG